MPPKSIGESRSRIKAPADGAAESTSKSGVLGRLLEGDPHRDHPEAGAGLALLKHFHWIEIGIRSYLRAIDNVDLSRVEGLILASIMLGYARPSDIARQQGVSRQAIHITIQQMRRKGIVDLIPDPTDGRIKTVALTDLAQKMNADGIIAMEQLWRELTKRIGRKNMERFAQVLHSDWGPPVTFEPDQE